MHFLTHADTKEEDAAEFLVLSSIASWQIFLTCMASTGWQSSYRTWCKVTKGGSDQEAEAAGDTRNVRKTAASDAGSAFAATCAPALHLVASPDERIMRMKRFLSFAQAKDEPRNLRGCGRWYYFAASRLARDSSGSRSLTRRRFSDCDELFHSVAETKQLAKGGNMVALGCEFDFNAALVSVVYSEGRVMMDQQRVKWCDSS